MHAFVVILNELFDLHSFEMKHIMYCKALCKAKTYNTTEKRSSSAYNRIRRSIVLEYVHHWYVCWMWG